MDGGQIFPHWVRLGEEGEGEGEVGVTIAVLRVVAEHLFRRDAIVEQTWKVGTTFVLVFVRRQTPTLQFDLHMTLIASPVYRQKETRLEDLHFTLRKSRWNPEIEQYTGIAANSMHYSLLAGQRAGNWVFTLRENREVGNSQRDEDEELQREAVACNVTASLRTFLEVLESLVATGEISVHQHTLHLRKRLI